MPICKYRGTLSVFFLQHYHTKNPKTLDYTAVMLSIHSSRNICLLYQPQIAWSCTLRPERGSNRYKDFAFLFLAKHMNYNLCIPHQRLIMRWLYSCSWSVYIHIYSCSPCPYRLSSRHDDNEHLRTIKLSSNTGQIL